LRVLRASNAAQSFLDAFPDKPLRLVFHAGVGISPQFFGFLKIGFLKYFAN
jgi:hypothetical protein